MACEASLKEQLIELKEWMINHKEFYNQYFISSNTNSQLIN